MDGSIAPAFRKDLESIHEAGQTIREIVTKMINLQRYTAKPYIDGVSIIDLDAASRKDA